MNCAEHDEKLTAHAMGELPAPEAAALKGHLAKCAKCRAALARLKKTAELVQEGLGAPAGLPQALTPERLARVRRAAGVGTGLSFVAIRAPLAAAALVLALLGLAGLMMPRLGSRSITRSLQSFKMGEEMPEIMDCELAPPLAEAVVSLRKERTTTFADKSVVDSAFALGGRHALRRDRGDSGKPAVRVSDERKEGNIGRGLSAPGKDFDGFVAYADPASGRVESDESGAGQSLFMAKPSVRMKPDLGAERSRGSTYRPQGPPSVDVRRKSSERMRLKSARLYDESGSVGDSLDVVSKTEASSVSPPVIRARKFLGGSLHAGVIRKAKKRLFEEPEEAAQEEMLVVNGSLPPADHKRPMRRAEQRRLVSLSERAEKDGRAAQETEARKKKERAEVPSPFMLRAVEKEKDDLGLETRREERNLITVRLDDVPLRDVVRMFTRISRASVIYDPTDLQGTVSVNLKDAPWKSSFRSILALKGHVLVERPAGSGIYVIARKPAEAAKLVKAEECKRAEERAATFKPAEHNPFYKTKERPLSTFAIDVDTASFTLARSYIARGQRPPPEAVRTEEFVNAFDYGYRPPRNRTFAVYSEWAPTPFGRGLHLLKIGVKGRRLGREEQRRLILTLLVDTSGSMNRPDRIGLIKRATALLLQGLDPADRVALVQFDNRARLVLQDVPVREKARILAAVNGLQCTGSTNLEEGMRLAYQVAARRFMSGAENRVLVFSDGAANLGAGGGVAILAQVARYRAKGIFCSIFGFGFGTYDDAILETLANKGNGTYAFVDSIREAKRLLVDDLAATMHVIASDVKIQVEFHADRVLRYRQIGYENRRLRDRDFRDDSIDAGEVGSGQSATALYEIELGRRSDRPLGVVRVRYRDAGSGLIEELENVIPGIAIARRFEEADPRFRLAACVAEFAEILRRSPFAAGSRPAEVANGLRPVGLELDMDSQIGAFQRVVEQAGGLAP